MPSSATSDRAHAVAVPPSVRAHRRRVVAWALAGGRPLDRDALAAVVGARARNGDPDRTPLTAADVGALLWVGIAEWCRGAGTALPHPQVVAATLLTYVDHLVATGGLAPGSDPPGALRRAVGEYGGSTGRARHPSRRQRPPAPVVPIVPIG